MLKKYIYRLFVITLYGFSVLLLSLAFVSLPEEKLSPDQAYRFYDRSDQLIATLIGEDETFRMHIPLKKISPLFIKTLLIHEDKYFYSHFGVNPFSIGRAFFSNLNAGRIVSGGSTITMQLARMIERRDRNLWSKIIESLRAIRLEIKYSKSDILAHYLALAPYGGNIEGIQAASYSYFGKPASELSIGEIALLAGIPKSPTKYRPDRHPKRAIGVRNSILKKMFVNGLINKDQYERGQKEPVNVRRKKLRNIIPHFAWKLRLETPKKYTYKTTIDENIQVRVTKLLKNYIATLEEFNITNASAVVIDNKTSEVRAIVGSVDYFSIGALGANNGAYIPRSPGSTLKPFLYALAFQNGLIAEKTTLYDIPINYAGYSPENYSKEFNGTVKVDEALTESLNVVAVRLSRELGYKKLYNLLKKGGVSSLNKPVEHYGLPLVLGGVELKLIELVNLYSSLARGGLYRPFKTIQKIKGNKKEEKDARILSKEATWLVSHIMKDVERPDFPESWMFTRNRPGIAWKTGTSYAHQDAWSVGFTPEYSIGVWLGNFDGSLSKGLSGSGTAAPVLFDIFQAVLPSVRKSWGVKPNNVVKRKVCMVSGKTPSRFCKNLTSEFFIKGLKGKTITDNCEIHQEIAIDVRSGKQAVSDTPKKFIQRKIYEIWPSEVATFLYKHGVPVRKVPPYNSSSMAGQKYYPPVILSPVKNTIYYKRFDKVDPLDHGIKLSCAITNRARKGFWLMDNKIIAETDLSKDIIINPGPGNYEIVLIDDAGGRAKVKLVVKDARELLEQKPESF